MNFVSFFSFLYQNSFLPLGGLESFCNSRLPFTPLFTDLSSSVVSSTIPPSLLLTLFPAIPFSHSKIIHDSLRAPLTVRSSSAAGDSSVLLLSPKAVENVAKAVTESFQSSGQDLVTTACDVNRTGTESHDTEAEQSLVARNWKLLTTSLCLAHSSLQESRLTSRSSLVCNSIYM